jgi:hypothetical protein
LCSSKPFYVKLNELGAVDDTIVTN